MKDLFSALSAAVSYPLVSLVLPGLTAISTWFLLLMRSAAFRPMVEKNHSETALVLLLVSIFAGTIIDDLGMRIESYWLDRQRDARTKGLHFGEWWAYLRTPFGVEPSGRRHLRNLVARLKFELGVPVAFLFALPGLWINQSMRYWPASLITALGVVLATYLLMEASSSHEELGTLRHELLQPLDTTDYQPKKAVRAING